MSKQEQLVSFVEKSSSRRASIVDKYGPTAVRYGSIVGGSRRRYVVDLSTDAPPPGTLTQRDRHVSSVVSANADCPEIHTEAQEHSEAQNTSETFILTFWRSQYSGLPIFGFAD